MSAHAQGRTLKDTSRTVQGLSGAASQLEEVADKARCDQDGCFVGHGGRESLHLIVQREVLTDAGKTGFRGRSGVFLRPSAEDRLPMLKHGRFYSALSTVVLPNLSSSAQVLAAIPNAAGVAVPNRACYGEIQCKTLVKMSESYEEGTP